MGTSKQQYSILNIINDNILSKGDDYKYLFLGYKTVVYIDNVY